MALDSILVWQFYEEKMSRKKNKTGEYTASAFLGKKDKQDSHIFGRRVEKLTIKNPLPAVGAQITLWDVGVYTETGVKTRLDDFMSIKPNTYKNGGTFRRHTFWKPHEGLSENGDIKIYTVLYYTDGIDHPLGTKNKMVVKQIFPDPGYPCKLAIPTQWLVTGCTRAFPTTVQWEKLYVDMFIEIIPPPEKVAQG